VLELTHSTRALVAVASAMLGSACARASVPKPRMLPDSDATIVGRVIDARGHRPLTDALVEVEQCNASGRTDSSGNFRIYAVPPGRRLLRTRGLGFYPGRGEIVLRAGSTYRVEIGIDLVMHCIDACEDVTNEPTPGFVRLIGVTPSKPVIDAMSITWCDSTPMKPVGRPVEIPTVPAPSLGFGAVIGSASEAETGDALGYTGVALVASPGGKGQSRKEKAADSRGGFAFDSVTPGDYELRVRSLNHLAQMKKLRVSANRVEIVRVLLPTYRCHGY
jgi:hypothetical protein